MKTILIDRNGYGIASLFSIESNSTTLIESKGMDGYFLDELNIKFNVGDKLKLKTPLNGANGFKTYNIEVYAITDKEYLCKFI